MLFLKKNALIPFCSFDFVKKCIIIHENSSSNQFSMDGTHKLFRIFIYTYALIAEVMIAISVFFRWHVAPYHKWLWKYTYFLQVVINMFPLNNTSIHTFASVDSWFITECNFHPIINIPWLFLFSHFNLNFFLFGLMLVFNWLSVCNSHFIQLIFFLQFCHQHWHLFDPFIVHFLLSSDIDLSFQSWCFVFHCPQVYFLILTIPFLLYLNQISDSTDWEQPIFFGHTLQCGLLSIFFSIDNFLIDTMLPFIRYVQLLVEVCKNFF